MTENSTLTGAPDAKFLGIASNWGKDYADQLLVYVWEAYDSMRENMPYIHGQSLERSITQALELRIGDQMSGYEPFSIQHGSCEYETMATPPAQPPTYDLAFVYRANERFMWPLEAKVLETPGSLAEYERDLREEYLTCRYAPFSDAGAMVGYLLKGKATDALNNIQTKIGCSLNDTPTFVSRPHKTSNHNRKVPTGKTYPSGFCCHHLVMEYPGLTRSTV